MVLLHIFKSDIDPPDKGLRGNNESQRYEKKKQIVMVKIPVNLNDTTTAHKLCDQ